MNQGELEDCVKAPPAAVARLLEDPDLKRVFAALDMQGEETRIVGGALRDALFKRPAGEIDLATTLVPPVIAAAAEAAGVRAIPTGIEHGTLTLLSGNRPFEVTTLREDIETFGRRATVRFGRDFRADALRRDFTINALSMTSGGLLFDYVGGLADIAARRVRFIGEPERRIREDYLRILRFFRFSADFAEGPLDAAGRLAAIRLRKGLACLSRKRVRAEILKLLLARRAAEICSEMSGDGLLHPLLGCVLNPARLRRVAAASPSMAKDPILRLAALCLNLPEDAALLRENLRLSNAESARLDAAARALLSLRGRPASPDRAGLQALLYRFGRLAASDAMLLAQTGAAPGCEAEWENARKRLAALAEPRLPFRGADIIARGFGQGKAVGAALKELEEAWIRAGFPDDPARLDRLAEETLGKQEAKMRGGKG